MSIGVDEAGVGPAVGALVAGAVVLPPEGIVGLTDSKKLTPRRREELYAAVTRLCAVGVGVVDHEEIDRLGLGEARRLVFERALDDLVDKHPHTTPAFVTVDGTLYRQWRDVPFRCEPKADLTVPEVSAASIVAKVTRDAQIARLCDERPDLDDKYQLRSNKGYLSAAHIEGIRKHGRSEFHRKSYRIRQIDG